MFLQITILMFILRFRATDLISCTWRMSIHQVRLLWTTFIFSCVARRKVDLIEWNFRQRSRRHAMCVKINVPYPAFCWHVLQPWASVQKASSGVEFWAEWINSDGRQGVARSLYEPAVYRVWDVLQGLKCTIRIKSSIKQSFTKRTQKVLSQLPQFYGIFPKISRQDCMPGPVDLLATPVMRQNDCFVEDLLSFVSCVHVTLVIFIKSILQTGFYSLRNVEWRGPSNESVIWRSI